PEPSDLPAGIDLILESIEILQDRAPHLGVVFTHEISSIELFNRSYSPLRSLRRSSLPEAERGIAFTNTYSFGRLKRASPPFRHPSSRAFGVMLAAAGSTNATTLAPSRSSGIPTTAQPATSGQRASASSTSSG